MGTNVVVAKEKPATPIYSYEISDEITYDGEQYYVLKDSDSSSDDVPVVRPFNLSGGESRRGA